MKIIEEARRDRAWVFWRLWSLRASLGAAAFWGAIAMLAAMWPGFAGAMPLWAWALIGVVLGAVVAVARLLKQPGLE
jgi:hypothetical protein